MQSNGGMDVVRIPSREIPLSLPLFHEKSEKENEMERGRERVSESVSETYRGTYRETYRGALRGWTEQKQCDKRLQRSTNKKGRRNQSSGNNVHDELHRSRREADENEAWWYLSINGMDKRWAGRREIKRQIKHWPSRLIDWENSLGSTSQGSHKPGDKRLIEGQDRSNPPGSTLWGDGAEESAGNHRSSITFKSQPNVNDVSTTEKPSVSDT